MNLKFFLVLFKRYSTKQGEFQHTDVPVTITVTFVTKIIQ